MVRRLGFVVIRTYVPKNLRSDTCRLSDLRQVISLFCASVSSYSLE